MQARLLAASLLPLSSYPLYAADDTVASPIIITATRTAQTVDETLAAVTVITRKDIERQQATTIKDVLRGTPGLGLSNNGGLGKATAVFLRGAESDHVLVLIDGVKVGSATTGQTAFEDIPIDQIERIEIVRGPRSSLYGSEAIGGVIQIFTHKGGGATTPAFSLGAGSHNTYKGAAGVSGGGAQGWYNVNVSGLSSDGFNTCRGSLSAGCYTFEPDDDANHNRSSTLRAGYRLDSGAEIDMHALYTVGDNEYDGTIYSGNKSKFLQDTIGATLQASPLAPWHVVLAAGRSIDKSDIFFNGVFTDRYNTTRDTVSFQNNITLGVGQLFTVGVDYQNDQIDNTAYTAADRRNIGVFTQHQSSYGAQDIQIAVRGDDNEQFGGHTTGGLAWGYNMSREIRLVASYGTAFKAPSFNELYFPFYGNPSLGPEKSQSYELGLRGKVSWGLWSFNTYQTNVDNLIAYDAAIRAAANIEAARIRGIEATVTTKFTDWMLGANLTLLDPENRSGGANNGKVLPRRSQETFRLDLDRSLGKFQFGGTLFAEGRRYDEVANTAELRRYTTVDMRVDYAFAKNWTLGGRVGNLFDKNYETAAFYNQDGRNYFITLRYQATARDGGSTTNAEAISSTGEVKQPI